MESKLEVMASVQPGKLSVICIAGGLMSPMIYSQIPFKDDVQFLPISWMTSLGPWNIEQLGERVAVLIDELKLGPTIIAGHSVGGAIALSATLAKPDRVDGLLLSNTGANTIGHGDPNLPDKIKHNWNLEFREAFIEQCFNIDLSPAFKRHLFRYAHSCSKEAFLISTTSLRQLDFAPLLSRISCPTVIAHGKYDTRRTIYHAEELKSNISNSELYLLNAGHTPMVEDSKGWTAALNLLLNRVRLIYGERSLT